LTDKGLTTLVLFFSGARFSDCRTNDRIFNYRKSWIILAYGDCDGNCLNDADGVCDEFEVAGCTSSSACNYDASATDAGYDCDGVCLNDADGDGVCDELEIAGCMDINALTYSSSYTDSSSDCFYAADFGDDCPFDANGDGFIGTRDSLMVLGMLGSSCP